MKLRCLFVLACLSCGPLLAVPVESPLSPGDALRAFDAAPGLVVELVAAEPLVASPCALAFDAKGRLFVAENRGYPIGPKEGEKPPGVIALLEDSDGDGKMDRRTVFADGLTFPNGVLPWKDGLIVTCAPDVLFFRDRDGDGVADERRVLLTGFATSGSTQLRVNAPTIGPDGWIYLAAGLSGGTISCPEHPERPPLKMTSDVRFHPETLAVEAVDGRSQFGMSFDAEGSRFICMNRLPVQHVVLESKWVRRNPRLAFSETVQDCNERSVRTGLGGGGAGVRLFPVSSNITTADSHAGSFSAACGVHVWRGGCLPEVYRGAVLSCDPTGNLVHADRLDPLGPTYAATPLLADREMLASRDDWFRPVFLTRGPEGALYVADMYRKVIEHPDYLPEEVRKHTDFVTGKDLGRIWRVAGKALPRVVSDSQKEPPRVAAPEARGQLQTLTAQAQGPDSRKRFAAALALGDVSGAESTRALAGVVLRDGEDKWVRNAVLSGIHDREGEFLKELLQQVPTTLRVGPGLAEVFFYLGGCCKDAAELDAASGASGSLRLAFLAGFAAKAGVKLEGLPASMQVVLENAPGVASDPLLPLGERVAAVRLLGKMAWGSAGAQLLKLALDDRSPELAEVALKAVAGYQEDAVAPALLAKWAAYAPAQRDAVLGVLLSSPRHVRGVLSAVESRLIPANALSGVRRRQVLATKDPELRVRAEKLLAVNDRPEAMAEARAALALTPAPANGHAVFRKLCTSCHRLDREGYAVGPDLFDIRRQTKENILFHIVYPNVEIAPAFAAYLAEAKDGRVFSGILVGEGAHSITLRGPIGAEVTVLRTDLAKLEALEGSLMPTGLEAGLSKQELADLLAYLKGEQ